MTCVLTPWGGWRAYRQPGNQSQTERFVYAGNGNLIQTLNAASKL